MTLETFHPFCPSRGGSSQPPGWYSSTARSEDGQSLPNGRAKIGGTNDLTNILKFVFAGMAVNGKHRLPIRI